MPKTRKPAKAQKAKATKTPATKSKIVKPIPTGYHTVTPYLIVKDAKAAIEFYRRALGATEICAMACQDSGKVMHAEIKVGDSTVMLSDECPDKGYSAPVTGLKPPVSLLLYVPNVDALFAQATKAGATSLQAPQDMFWGDRFSTVQDPFGHVWSIATHKRDVTPEEMERAAKEYSQKQQHQQPVGATT